MRILIIIILGTFLLNAQEYYPIDKVVAFKPGSGQNTGQSEEYYPENIFGFPSKNASVNRQETSPKEILSLGLEGEITVRIENRSIVNREGYDFVIYENAFTICKVVDIYI